MAGALQVSDEADENNVKLRNSQQLVYTAPETLTVDRLTEILGSHRFNPEKISEQFQRIYDAIKHADLNYAVLAMKDGVYVAGGGIAVHESGTGKFLCYVNRAFSWEHVGRRILSDTEEAVQRHLFQLFEHSRQEPDGVESDLGYVPPMFLRSIDYSVPNRATAKLIATALGFEQESPDSPSARLVNFVKQYATPAVDAAPVASKR